MTRRFWYCVALGGVFNLVYLAWILLRPEAPATHIIIGDLWEIVTWTLGALLCFGAVRWSSGRKKDASQHLFTQKPFILLGVGIICAVVGQIVYTYYDMHPVAPFPSWADIGFIGSFLFLIPAILLMPSRSLSSIARSRVLLDGFMIVLAVLTFSWYFTLGPNILQRDASLFAVLVSAAYPFFDLVMFLCVLFLMVRWNEPTLRISTRLLAIGLLCLVISDSVYSVQILQGTYETGTILDIGYAFGYIIIGLSAQAMYQYNTKPGDSISLKDYDSSITFWRELLPYLFVLAVVVLVIYLWQSSSSGLLASGVYLLSGLLIICVILRQFFAIRENRRLNTRLHTVNARLEALATTDPLTGLPNHRALAEAFVKELKRARRYERPCALIFTDIDHFKALNDGYGHPAGDVVLRDFANISSRELRTIDVVGRWGGEEFLAILPETTAEEALVVAERIRIAVSDHVFPVGGGIRLTCSQGIASAPFDGRELDQLVTAADKAMYAAKELGRNQVRMARDPAVHILVNEHEKSGSREDTALLGTVEALSVLVEARDLYSKEHSHEVSALALRLSLELGLDEAEARMVGIAGKLHDIGKIAIPDSVLRKPSDLTNDEREMICHHPVVGADVVSRVPVLRSLAPLIRHHHERWDGEGYPDGLSGETIPLGARVLAVVDAYSVMKAERPFCKARTLEEALSELCQCAGTQFDPDVVIAFVRMLTFIAHERVPQNAVP